MIYKFVSNDNKGNVNTVEFGSNYSKISNVVDPVNDGDAVNKKYVDDALEDIVPPSSGGGALTVNVSWNVEAEWYILDKTYAEIKEAYTSGVSIQLVYASINDDPSWGSVTRTYYNVVGLKETEYTGSETDSSDTYEVFTENYDFLCNDPDDYPTSS